MTSAKKIYLAVAGGLVAAGVVLAGIGFIASGFDPAVFTTQIDTRDSTIVLGGVEVDDPTGLPLIEQLAGIGEVDTSGITASESPCCPGGAHRSLSIACPDAPSVGLCKPVEPGPQPQPNRPRACVDSLPVPRGGP